MTYRRFVATLLLVCACSDKPAPEDSFYISQSDYSGLAAPAVDIGGESGNCVCSIDTLVSPDSLRIDSIPPELSGTLESSDSVETSADSLELSPFPDEWRFVEIVVQGSLYQSLTVVADAEPDILGAHCVRNLVWEMNPWSGFIAGDTLRIIYTTEEQPRENMVVAFEYMPVAGSSNHPFSGYVFTKEGDNWPSVWKPDGTELVKLMNRMPVQTFEEITSVFGEPRGTHVHEGVDFKAPEGTQVFSVTGGTVVRTNWNTVYNGNCVEIDFGGYSEIFLHLNSIESCVVPGARIEPGDKVGTVGNTGRSTAAHLHYQINGPDGYAIDPYLYFGSHRRNLNASEMNRFRERVEMCREMMGE